MDFKSDLKQLKLLLWKNVNLQKRSLIGLILELIVPAFFAIILLPIRGIVKSKLISNDTFYDTFNLTTFPTIIDGFKVYPPEHWYIGYTPGNSTLASSIMEQTVNNLKFRGSKGK